ncbi:hypothetical protein VNO77_44249 [Canavalia gladiata]|uniref:Uncharacterized protein n=1 Tax=Canavalia gladiata TaxID=3824 RepID=A0AAN9PNM0_CANGL
MKAFNRSNSHPSAKSHRPQTRHPLLQTPHPKSSGWRELSLLPRGGPVLTKEDPHQYGSIIAWRNYLARRFQEDWVVEWRSPKQPSHNDKDGDAERQALNEPADIAIAKSLRLSNGFDK